MSPAMLVTVVIGAFFLIGIGVGVVLVIAISVLRPRAERARRTIARRADTGDRLGLAGEWDEDRWDEKEEGLPPWPGRRGLIAGGHRQLQSLARAPGAAPGEGGPRSPRTGGRCGPPAYAGIEDPASGAPPGWPVTAS